MPSREAVLALVERAWGELPLPAAGTIAGRQDSCGEYAYVAEFFPGMHWRAVTLEWLDTVYPGPGDACLSFMSADAFRYYLASYLAIALAVPESSHAATDTAVFQLSPPRYDPALERLAREHGGDMSRAQIERLREWWQPRSEGFSAAQREAIEAFLAWRADGGDSRARESLDHWRARR
jgi:hypothetical protein